MENRNIIIILIIIIIILAVAVSIMFLQQNVKTQSEIKITSNETLYVGDMLSILLTDFNNTPISDEKVNVQIDDDNGNIVVNKTVKTNSKGIVNFNLDLGKGNYTVRVNYGGNDNCTGNNTTQKLTIEEIVVEEPAIQQSTVFSTSSNEIRYDEDLNVYYDSNDKIVDPDGEHSQGVGSSYSELRDAKDRWVRGEPVRV